MSSTWSAQLADRYRCELSPELADWFDREIWKQEGRGEYRKPINPESLILEAPESIWPGLMPCDLLPIISNAAGDWLCARVDRDNVASEVVQWYHGGGDWIPWGKNLAEAILFDAVVDRLPGTARRHAVPAEDPRPNAGQKADDPILHWALEHLPDSVASALDPSLGEDDIAQVLLDGQIAEIAVRCELVVAGLMQWTRKTLESFFNADASINRDYLAEWSFDVDRIPRDTNQQFEQQHGVTLLGMQDWYGAEGHARRVIELDAELAWAWDIAGYAAERRGDLEGANAAYQRAAGCSVFTDQSIRLETHWTAAQSAKFSVARLFEIDLQLVSQSTYLSALCDSDPKRGRAKATAYWKEQGSQFEKQGDLDKAYRCYVAAGWDVGADSMAVFADLLDRISAIADQLGHVGRAETARTHRRCLRERHAV
jgi:tetratricopeptide (TPR) repeat protein